MYLPLYGVQLSPLTQLEKCKGEHDFVCSRGFVTNIRRLYSITGPWITLI